MSVSSQDVEDFFKTLLLGDFVEDQQQMVAAQVIGGLISLIPVLDQVMDVRDVSGSLFRINRQGGFGRATPDQVVGFGFAAFGVIPEVGSAFKTVFKPLWKERRAAKAAVHGGLEAMERMLGMGKGGAVRWIRNFNWAGRTQQAIVQANYALDACIELMEFVATAKGWKGWLIPDPVQALAGEMLPPLKGMRGKLAAPIQRATGEIREFLTDLLGEQAAAVAMAVGERAVAASAVPGTRSRSGHNAAAVHPTGRVPARQGARKVQAAERVEAKKGAGAMHATVQATRKALSSLANQEKGLIGEHVVDYHELKRLGGNWPHDRSEAHWSPATVHKLNVDKRPVNLSLADLRKVCLPGIDSVWEHAGDYTVTEAKASESIGAVYGIGKFKERKGQIPVVSGLSPDHQLLHYLLSDSSDKRGTQTPLMQMSKQWVEDRAKREGLPPGVAGKLAQRNAHSYSRRTVLVTLESQGALDHVEALVDAHAGKTGTDMHPHVEHGATREWSAAAIDAVDNARLRAHESRKPPPGGPGDTPPAGTTKPTRKKKR